MKYNLAKHSNTYDNLTVGNVNFTQDDLRNLVTGVCTVAVTSGTNDIVCVETDLGARIKTYMLRYLFSSPSASGTVSSGIEFYYKNDEPDNYSSLTTTMSEGYYTATIPGASTPRFVRVVHTISGTAVSGTVVGFEVLNDDEDVDFGIDGTTTSVSSDNSVYGGSDVITEVSIYNDSAVKRTAYVSLEPQGTNVDDFLTISTTSGGPWVGVKEDNTTLGSSSAGWTAGTRSSETEIDGNNKLTLATQEASGTFTTEIFENTEKNSFIYLDIESELKESMVTTDTNKEVRTIEVRGSGQRPKDRALVRQFYYTGGSDRELYYKDYHRDDGALEYTSGYLGDSSRNQNPYVYYAKLAPESGYTRGILYKAYPSADWKRVYIFDIGKDSDSFSTTTLWSENAATGTSISVYDMEMGKDDVTWVSMYTSRGISGYTLDQAGYYIIRFRGNRGTAFKENTSYKQPTAMSIVYDTASLWFTDRNNNMVKLVNSAGTVTHTYSITDLYGISATSDGGCWVVDRSEQQLVQLDSSANLVKTLTDVITSSASWLKMDGDDAMYVRDGTYLKRILTDGTIDFSVEIADFSKLYDVTDTGVWIYKSGGYWAFFDKETQEVKANVYNTSRVPAFMDYAYDDEDRTDMFPISSDSVWSPLAWNEVHVEQFPLALGYDYHQVRVTLQSNYPSDMYNVTETEWEVEDYFTQADGTAPKDHRWWPSDDTSSISALSNRMRFYGGVGGSKSIQSSHPTITERQKWYIDTNGGANDIDIQLYYRLSGSWNPPPTNHYVYIRLYSLDEGYVGDYAEALVYRTTSTQQRLYARVYKSGTTYFTGYNTYTPSYNYGYLRLHWDKTNDRMRAYDYINGVWQYNEASPMSSYPIGNTFYVWIYMPDHGASNDVDIDSFIFNQNLGDVVFYEQQAPVLDGVHIQKSIEVPDIYPGTAKSIYLKNSLSSQDLSLIGSYDSKLKAWWEVPV